MMKIDLTASGILKPSPHTHFLLAYLPALPPEALWDTGTAAPILPLPPTTISCSLLLNPIKKTQATGGNTHFLHIPEGFSIQRIVNKPVNKD